MNKLQTFGLGLLAFICGMIAIRWTDRMFPTLTKAPQFLPKIF